MPIDLVVADRPGPPNSITYESGGRVYLFGDKRYWSVTTALDGVEAPALVWWAAYLTFDLVVEERERVLASLAVKPCGRSYSRCRHDPGERGDCCACQECQACVRRWAAEKHVRESDRRADEGSRTHHFGDWWATHGGEHIGYDPDIAVYVRSFLAFVEEYGLTPESFLLTERTGVNRFHKYAGTLDAIVRFRARATPAAAKLVARVLGITAEAAIEADATVDLLVDFKTQEKTADDGPPKFYPKWALQQAAYRRFTSLRMKGSDDEEPMPPTGGAAIVLLRPDAAIVRPVVTDDAAFDGFLGYLAGWTWLVEHGADSVANRSFPLLKPEKPKRRRRTAATDTPPPGANPAA